ncbi:MAG TPA: hypothetical protein VN721_14520, partial [Flavipsychrobacter sp.]|nr:hypothetical protein [Flavipsychrobacter sp.]
MRSGHNICILLACFIVFLLPAHIASADSLVTERTITTTQWQQLTNDSSFNYKNDKEGEINVRKRNSNLFTTIVIGILTFFGSSLGKTIVWLFFFFIFGYVLFKIFSGEGGIFQRRNKDLGEEGDLPPADEENLLQINWETRLQQAANDNDTRLAIRYGYMWLLQILQYGELIQYRSDKTNYDYYNELRETAYNQDFKQLLRVYEYAWYGHLPVAPTTY